MQKTKRTKRRQNYFLHFVRPAGSATQPAPINSTALFTTTSAAPARTAPAAPAALITISPAVSAPAAPTVTPPTARHVEFVSCGDSECVCSMAVTEAHQNGMGTLHGGVTSTLVDAVSTWLVKAMTGVSGVSVDMNITHWIVQACQALEQVHEIQRDGNSCSPGGKYNVVREIEQLAGVMGDRSRQIAQKGKITVVVVGGDGPVGVQHTHIHPKPENSPSFLMRTANPVRPSTVIAPPPGFTFRPSALTSPKRPCGNTQIDKPRPRMHGVYS